MSSEIVIDWNLYQMFGWLISPYNMITQYFIFIFYFIYLFVSDSLVHIFSTFYICNNSYLCRYKSMNNKSYTKLYLLYHNSDDAHMLIWLLHYNNNNSHVIWIWMRGRACMLYAFFFFFFFWNTCRSINRYNVCALSSLSRNHGDALNSTFR